jgi:hypothetical protein
LTIVALSALLGAEVTSVSLAVSGSEISWASEVEWGSLFESTAFENGLTNTSVAEGSAQAPSASDTLVFSDTGMAISETVALIIWSIYFCDNSNFRWLWEISGSNFFFSLIAELAGITSSPCVTFPHNEVGSLVGLHSLSEGFWCVFIPSEGTEASSLGMLKVSEDVVDDLDFMTSLLEDQSATSGGGNIKDILGSVWIFDSKVFISEY